MGLNCGCPLGAHINDLTVAACKVAFGQTQKLLFQRIYSSGATKNSFPAAGSGQTPAQGSIVLKASWTTKLSAADSTKVTVSPYVQNPETEPGAARTFGGDNQTRGGIPITIGREPTTFTGVFYQESQATMAALKDYYCEEIGVYLIDEYGNIGCLADDVNNPTTYYPIPIQEFFVGDLKLGGYSEPDSNAISFGLVPNWSDKFTIVKQSTMDFNPLSDLANVASGA